MKQQDRMEVLKMMTKRTISAGRVVAPSSWWVSELPAIDCATVWLKLEAEELMNEWLGWLHKEMQKKGEKKGDLEGCQRLVGNIISSTEGCTDFLRKVTHTKANSLKRTIAACGRNTRGCRTHEEVCGEEVWARQWPCHGEVQEVEN